MKQAQDRWYTQRKIFLVLTLTSHGLCRTGLAGVTLLLLRYYRDVIEVDNPRIYYGIAVSVYMVSCLVTVKVSSLYMNKTQNIRRIADIALGFGTLGCFIYSIPLSRWLPILGLLMVGFTESLRISTIAELSRVYDQKSLAKHLTILGAVNALSHILGPTLPLMFSTVDLQFGVFKVNMYNAYTIFFGCLWAMFWIVCRFLLPNLTLDPKYEILKHDIFQAQQNKGTTVRNQQPMTTTDLLKNKHVLIMYASDVIWSHFNFQTDLLFNMVATYDFHWSMRKIAILIGVCPFIAFLLLLVVQKYCLSSSINIYYLNLSCFIFMVITQSLTNFVRALEINGTIVQLLMFGFAVVCHEFQAGVATGSFRWLLFAITPHNSASVVESNRYIFAESSSVLAYFLSGYVYPYLTYVFPFYNFLCYFMIIVFLLHEKGFLDKCRTQENQNN